MTRPIFPSFPHLVLSREDILERIEAGARNRLGISAGEFLRGYRRGEISHDLEDGRSVLDLLGLSDLLDPNDPIWTEETP